MIESHGVINLHSTCTCYLLYLHVYFPKLTPIHSTVNTPAEVRLVMVLLVLSLGSCRIISISKWHATGGRSGEISGGKISRGGLCHPGNHGPSSR